MVFRVTYTKDGEFVRSNQSNNPVPIILEYLFGNNTSTDMYKTEDGWQVTHKEYQYDSKKFKILWWV